MRKVRLQKVQILWSIEQEKKRYKPKRATGSNSSWSIEPSTFAAVPWKHQQFKFLLVDKSLVVLSVKRSKVQILISIVTQLNDDCNITSMFKFYGRVVMDAHGNKCCNTVQIPLWSINSSREAEIVLIIVQIPSWSIVTGMV